MTKLVKLDAPRAVRSARPVVVLDFGSDPFAGPEAVSGAARTIAFEIERGNAVVAVLPPYSDETFDFVSLAADVSAAPHPRELDLLVSSAALMANALCGLAVHRLGHRVVALDPSQAGIVTDGVHRHATVVGVDVGRIEHELGQHDGVLVSGSVASAQGTHELTVLGATAPLVAILADALGGTPRRRSSEPFRALSA